MGCCMSASFACLTYHDIGEKDNQYTVSHVQMHAQMSFLHAEGYTVEGFEQLQNRLDSDQSLPDRYVVVTMDDGLSSTMLAADCLEQHGFKATFFVIRDSCLKKPGFIREREIRELRQRGFSLGTHGTTHRKLTKIPEEQCRHELLSSRAWLEDLLGEPVHFMAAPGGFINSLVMRIAAEQAYLLVATCNEWMNVFSPELQMSLKVNRVNIRRHFSSMAFRNIVEGQLQFYLRRQLRSSVLWLPKQLLPA
jgi:peptidoglycan/xylan/chitin deacetylase (PgdA/CDA1 family)